MSIVPLYDPQRHVALPPIAWAPERVRDWLMRWAGAALAVWAEKQCWPQHPRDVSDSDQPGPLHGLYVGATGVWLALARLGDAQLCRLPMSLGDIFALTHAAYLGSPDTGEVVPSWFLGETAPLTARYLAAPEPASAERLTTLIRSNRENPAREALWGAPGTLHACLFLYEASHDERWAALFRDSVAALWSSWSRDETVGVWLWEQDLYGRRTRYLGAGHGWVGNLHPLWRGYALLSRDQQTALGERTVDGLAKLALVDGDVANWPPLTADTKKMLVQWCHGAPGFITSLRHAAPPEILPLLRKGAELIVRAGPLDKGVALCHGTDGNGMALLEMYRRTGEPQWLAQARQFAMWALVQSEADFVRYGEWRHSLWTGDAGLACFLLDCLNGTSRGMPGLDSLW